MKAPTASQVPIYGIPAALPPQNSDIFPFRPSPLSRMPTRSSPPSQHLVSGPPTRSPHMRLFRAKTKMGSIPFVPMRFVRAQVSRFFTLHSPHAIRILTFTLCKPELAHGEFPLVLLLVLGLGVGKLQLQKFNVLHAIGRKQIGGASFLCTRLRAPDFGESDGAKVCCKLPGAKFCCKYIGFALAANTFALYSLCTPNSWTRIAVHACRCRRCSLNARRSPEFQDCHFPFPLFQFYLWRKSGR